MKKSLSLLVAIAMVFSMFASVAFAADATTTATEKTTQQKFDELKAAGVFTGYPGGGAGLENEMTRAEFAKVLAKIANLKDNAAAAKNYSDVSKTHWAVGQIGSVTEAGFMTGVGASKFAPTGKVTLEQVAKIATLVGGIPQLDKAVTGKVSPWAKGYVAAAIEAGLLPEAPSYQVNAKRGALVDVAYKLYSTLSVTVKEAKVIDAKNIEVTFTDGGVVKKALDTALVAGTATKVTVEYNGTKYEVTVTLQALTATATVVGAKKVEVKLNQAVDTAKVTFEVKNATNTVVNVAKTTFSDDKMTATLEFATNLIAGDYTIAAKGATTDASAKITVVAEKIAKIEFVNDKAVFSRTDAKVVTSTVKISNQYGEDVTAAKSGQLTVTAGKGVASLATSGVLTIDNNTAAGIAASNTVFAKDEKVAVSAIDSASNTFASVVLTVADKAQVAEIAIEKLYNADNETLAVGSTAGNFKLVISAKDQYGNKISNATDFANDTVLTIANPTVTNVVGGSSTPTYGWDANIDGGKLTLTLAGTPGAGTSKVTIISKTSGKLASFDVVVKEAVKVDVLTLSAPAVAVAGADIEIPFVAVDQFGVAITSASALKSAGALLSLTSSAGNLDFVQDYVKKTAKLVLSNVTTKGTVVVAAVTGTGKVQQVTISVVDAAVPTVISATKDLTTTLAKTAVVDFSTGNVVVKDQYGRDITPTWGGANYSLDVTSSDTGKVTYASGKLTAVAKGSSTITVKLLKNNIEVAGSAFTFTVKVVEKGDIQSYEVPDLGTLLDNGNTDHDRQVTVNGVLADATKVAVPNDFFTVDTITSGLSTTTPTSNKLHASLPGATPFANGDVTATFVVTVTGGNGEVISKTVKVSNAASVADKLELQTAGAGTKEGDLILSAAKGSVDTVAEVNALATAVVKTTDQYGVAITPSVFTKVYITNISNGHTITDGVAPAPVSTIAAGDTFNVVAITANGKTITFQVVVKA
ncbi:hypothetical protein Back11_52350 [Paenibacillus baekrokdamisoli]|uniref:SLH domain-containing protein n=2 Tax=Paenibacillus baekrokdamisoli TaxID=1712516 RepID=A0A3G9IYD5_9BACL|nr:hypothetical protein Back11_52350 [Paenibacillus baekrokdamisoli]